MYTNKTRYYELPQYVSTDIPSILDDFNEAMSKIDAAIHNVATGGVDLTDAVEELQVNYSALNLRVTELGTQVETCTESVERVDSEMNDDTNGLVVQIARLTNAVADLEQRVSALES